MNVQTIKCMHVVQMRLPNDYALVMDLGSDLSTLCGARCTFFQAFHTIQCDRLCSLHNREYWSAHCRCDRFVKRVSSWSRKGPINISHTPYISNTHFTHSAYFKFFAQFFFQFFFLFSLNLASQPHANVCAQCTHPILKLITVSHTTHIVIITALCHPFPQPSRLLSLPPCIQCMYISTTASNQ